MPLDYNVRENDDNKGISQTITLKNKHEDKALPEETKKNRGKYLKECSNGELVYNRPHRRKRDEILYNHGAMGPIWI